MRVSFLSIVLLGLRIRVMKIDDISISKSEKLCVGTGRWEVAQLILVTLAMFTKLLWFAG